MSLVRLLTAGKSLIGLKPAKARYHLETHRPFPQFGSPTNRFRATTRPEKAQTTALVPPSDLPVGLAKIQKAEVAASDRPLAPAAPSSTTAKTPLAVKKPNGENVVRGPRPVSKLSNWLGWRRPKGVRASAGPFGKPMVQAELSLEQVKVVRNDLSETDLEIVRAKPAPATDQMPRTFSAMTGVPASAWNRMAGRLFGAGKM